MKTPLFFMALLTLLAGVLSAQEVEKLSEPKTLLFIRTVPEGARVLIDGKKAGVTDDLFRVEPGVRRIVIELDGHTPQSKELTIRAGRITRLVLQLKESELSPETGPVSFTPVIERVVNDDTTGSDWMIDLDTGKLYTPPTQLDPEKNPQADTKKLVAWVRQQGIDATGIKAQGGELQFFECVLTFVDKASWESVTQQQVRDALAEAGDPIDKAVVGDTLYAFRTREGGMGVLQVVGRGDDSPSVKIRYKMVLRAGSETLDGTSPPTKVHLPDADTPGAKIVLDLASGQLLASPDAKNDVALLDHFRRLGKGDLVYDRLLICLREAKVAWWTDNRFVAMPLDFHEEQLRACKLPGIPCRLLITTAEKKHFDVTILARTEDGGINLEYREADPAVVPETKLIADPVPSSPAAVAPALKAIINDADSGQGRDAIDLDRAHLFDLPDANGWSHQQQEDWLADNGIDLAAEYENNLWTLGTTGMALSPIRNDSWDTITATELDKVLSGEVPSAKLDMTVREQRGSRYHTLNFGVAAPVTFAFKTAEGSSGVLRIAEFSKAPPSVTILFKVLKPAAGMPTPTKVRVPDDPRSGVDIVGYPAYALDQNGGPHRAWSKPVEIEIVAAEPQARSEAAGGWSDIETVMASLRSDLVKISSAYPELPDADAVRITRTDVFYGLKYIRNCTYLGKRGHEDTGPHPVHLRFEVYSLSEQGDPIRYAVRKPDHTWANLGLVGWTRVYVGKDASPGFAEKARQIIDRHVAMVDALDRRAKDTPQPVAKDWGWAVEGVQFRLHADKLSWPQGTPPELLADFRNRGERDLQIELEHESWRLEIDGKWHRTYIWRSGLRRSVPLGSGQDQIDVKIWIDADDNLGRKLRELKPGKHTLRVARHFRQGPPEERLRVVSNPIEIEIAAGDEDPVDTGANVAGSLGLTSKGNCPFSRSVTDEASGWVACGTWGPGF